MIERYLYPTPTSELIEDLCTPTRMKLDRRTGTYRGKIEGIGTVEVEPDEFLAEGYWPRKDPAFWTDRKGAQI